MKPHPDNNIIVPVHLDAETVNRLARFARAVGEDPVRVAASLLRDLIWDDEFADLNSLGQQPLNS